MIKKAKDAEALPRFTAIIKNIKNATFIKTTKSYFKMMFGKKDAPFWENNIILVGT